MTFTEEQIREAWERVANSPGDCFSVDLLVAELTRPQPEFREKEVVYNFKSYGYGITYTGENCRKLRLSEMPEAVEQLREATDMCECSDTVAHALADFDREIES